MIRNNFSRDTITRFKRAGEETQNFANHPARIDLIDGAKALGQEMLER